MNPRHRPDRYRIMLAGFAAGTLLMATLGALVAGQQWLIAVGVYVVVSGPLYAVWEWYERRLDRKAWPPRTRPRP